MTVANSADFASACQEAMVAVLGAITAAGKERRGLLTTAKSAVARALHDAHTGAEWCLADQLRRGIKGRDSHAGRCLGRFTHRSRHAHHKALRRQSNRPWPPTVPRPLGQL